MTQVLAEAAPFGSTILLYSKLSRENSNVDNFTALVKDLHFDGWFLPNWLRKKNIFQILQLSRQAQALIGDDLSAPIHKHLPLSQAQQGLEEYVQKMSAGKILLVMDTQQGGF
jgi:hypothetical protein